MEFRSRGCFAFPGVAIAFKLYNRDKSKSKCPKYSTSKSNKKRLTDKSFQWGIVKKKKERKKKIQKLEGSNISSENFNIRSCHVVRPHCNSKSPSTKPVTIDLQIYV
jgi:hypothetical protein